MRLRSIIHNARVTRSPSSFHRYQYESLPTPTCIRLLEVLPSGNSKTIRCSLKTFELQEAPSFRALSYTWGHAHTVLSKTGGAKEPSRSNRDGIIVNSEASGLARRHAIICDGGLIKVTSNLRDALLMLANATDMPLMPKIPTYYWIDALCMDQGKISERNNQVARMADVYRKADGVVVWLGKDDEYVDDALTTIRGVSAMPERDWPLVSYTSFYRPDEPHLGHISKLSFHNWLGFMVLINRPWFKRSWVVQEIALAKSALVVCGSKVFTWDLLSKTLSFVKTTRWYHHLHTEKLKHVKQLQKHPGIYRRVLQSKLSVGMSPVYLDETRLALLASANSDVEEVRSPPFRMLMDKHRFTNSSDPRDKVYAFLGLADKALFPFSARPNLITPDYHLSVQAVYTDVARFIMTSYPQNLTWLSHVEDASQRRIPDLPSWVPDLSVPLDPYPLRFRGPGYWKAAGNRTWKPNISSMQEGLLEVQGYHIDHIDQTSALLHESEDPSATWASIVKLALSLNLPYPDPGKSTKKPSRVEILWRILTTNIYNHTYPAPPETDSLFIDYILNLQIRHRLMPWSSTHEFQPHHSPLSDSLYPEWRTLLSLEPPDSPYSLEKYTKRLTTVVESMFDGTYSPIALAQLQHEIDQSGGKKRRLFKSSGGFMGTGPRSLRTGDEVWVLHRGGLPFVLRRQHNGRYRLVGECFVYGIMHGEALLMDLPRRSIVIE